MDRQPTLTISYQTKWSAAKIVLEHLSNAPECPTFTIQREKDGVNVRLWMSKRTYDWLKGVLQLDPRAHKEEK